MTTSRWLIAAVLALFCASLPVHQQLLQAAEQNEAPDAQLQRVNTAIGEIESWLQQARQQRSAEEAALADITRRLDGLNNTISQNRSTVARLDDQLATLQAQEAELIAASEAQRQLVAQALRATHMSGGDSQLKLLLTQQDPGTAQRMLVYFEAFNNNRLLQIRQWQNTLDSLERTNADLAGTRNALERTNRDLQNQLAELQAGRETRSQLIASLNADMATRAETLAQLTQDRAHLQELIDEINRIIVDIPAPEDLMPFTESRGRLPWPVQGNLLSRFGERYGGGNLQRQGIIIGADVGTAVRAVHPGRVVFSDWLRGSGNLVVVDHGNSHISLYAHNQSLIKQSGDWVSRGEAVALSGTDAGTGDPGIYFEIRRNSQPLNPVEWLEAQR